MKHLSFGFLGFLILIGTPAWGKDAAKALFTPTEKPAFEKPISAAEILGRQVPELPAGATLQDQMEAFMNAPAQKSLAKTAEDGRLVALLSVAPEDRPYVFPEVHDDPFVSKKIRSHPDIVIFKDTMPPVPDVLKPWAEKHLRFLPSAFYSFLNPKRWEKKELVMDAKQLNALFPTMKKPDPYRKDTRVYPTLQEFYPLPDDLKNTYFESDLSEKNVGDLAGLIVDLKELFQSQPQPLVFQNSISIDTFLNQLQFLRAVKPFEIWFGQLKRLGQNDRLQALAEKYGYASAEVFAQTMDRLLTAYRADTLSATKALQIQKMRHIDLSAQDPVFAQKVKYYALAFAARPGDVYFIRPHAAKIKALFKSDDFKALNIPIILD